MHTVSRWVDSRYSVLAVAVLTFVLRIPGMGRPARPDEAGFLLVARSWNPAPDSVYGQYFVDRPPLLIAFLRLVDPLGGVLAVRVVGALGCALTVVLAAWLGRLIAHRTAGRWAALATAAVITNTLIDPVAVKGELLALPLVLGSMVAAVLALQRRATGSATGPTTGSGNRSAAGWAALGGLLGMAAVGFKQNLVGGLVFGGVLLLAAWATRRLTRREALPLALAALGGAAVPVLATVGWALAEGVRISTLSYAVLGFRSDATAVLAGGGTSAPTARAVLLLGVAVGIGLVLIFAGFLIHIRGEFRDDPSLTLATAALLLADLALLVAGGSFWLDYLFGLVPSGALVVALLARRGTRRGWRMRVVVSLSAVSSAVSVLVWVGLELAGALSAGPYETGAAIAVVAEADDTLTVFGGRADIQLASGLGSPYAHLWSLPMRTLDPQYADLRALLDSPQAPTWFVPWVGFGSWGNPAGAELLETVRERYVVHGTGCRDRPVLLLRGVDRAPLQASCP